MLPVTEADANIPWFPFDSWEQLTPAFGQLKSMVGAHGPKLIANNRTATFFDRNVHEGFGATACIGYSTLRNAKTSTSGSH
jgi:hypothetical protein